MLSLKVVACLAGACLGQADKKEPAPDRFVRVKLNEATLPRSVHKDFRQVKQTMLLIDRINFGYQFHQPNDPEALGHPDKDFSRFAGCYFHPKGPAGIALQKFDWFPGRPNTYAADVRLPAALVGQAVHGGRGLLVTLWSEPAYAVLGIDTGSLVSLARPAQTVHCIERIPKVVALSAPPKGKEPTFTFIRDARARGACVAVEQGELRPTLEKKKIQRFYHLMFIQPHKDGENTIQKELFTKEGMTALMDTMAEQGVICFHTSSRYFEFPKLIADACDQTRFAYKVGHDNLAERDWELNTLHFISEWIMVARKPEYLKHLVAPEGYKAMHGEPYWSVPKGPGQYQWTDAGKKSMKGMVRSDPQIGSFATSIYDLQDWLAKLGIPPQTFHRILNDISDMIRRWGDRVAKERDY